MKSRAGAPLVVEFVFGSYVRREPPAASGLPVIQNGPPGTFVVFRDGSEVPLPTDQVVVANHLHGHATVGFGGMRYGGVENSQLVFHRVRDLAPEAELSPERGVRMTLEPHMVMVVLEDDVVVWSTNAEPN